MSMKKALRYSINENKWEFIKDTPAYCNMLVAPLYLNQFLSLSLMGQTIDEFLL